MSGRKITVTLTEAQYDALADAIATRDAEDEGREDMTPSLVGAARARRAAWAKINAAWWKR